MSLCIRILQLAILCFNHLIVSVDQIQHEVSLRELPSSVFCDAKPTHEKQKTVPNVCKLISTLPQNRHKMPAVSIVSLLLFTHHLNCQLKAAGILDEPWMLTLAANVLARQVQYTFSALHINLVASTPCLRTDSAFLHIKTVSLMSIFMLACKPVD